MRSVVEQIARGLVCLLLLCALLAITFGTDLIALKFKLWLLGE